MSSPESVLYRAFTKATQREVGELRYSANWIISRRAWFKIYSDRVECGDWVIHTDEVREAVLYEARRLLLPVRVLAVSTATDAWQFGFNPWADIAPHLPFPVRRERIRLRYSAFSVIVRLIVLAYLAYYVAFKKVKKGGHST